MVILLAKLFSISETSCDGSLAHPLIGSGQMEDLKVGDILKNGGAPFCKKTVVHYGPYGLFHGVFQDLPRFDSGLANLSDTGSWNRKIRKWFGKRHRHRNLFFVQNQVRHIYQVMIEIMASPRTKNGLRNDLPAEKKGVNSSDGNRPIWKKMRVGNSGKI